MIKHFAAYPKIVYDQTYQTKIFQEWTKPEPELYKKKVWNIL